MRYLIKKKEDFFSDSVIYLYRIYMIRAGTYMHFQCFYTNQDQTLSNMINDRRRQSYDTNHIFIRFFSYKISLSLNISI